MMTAEQVRATVERLTPGTEVGHANPELADWAGTITPNRRGRLWDLGRYVHVAWQSGTAAGAAPATGWYIATALTVAGKCPDCERPAHYIQAGNDWDRSEGWHHDSPADSRTCWAGKARFEAGSLGIS
jgi:hypothetical protein